MEENPIGRLMNTTMENVRNVLKTDTVVGDPITTPDGMMLVPISRISMGFGGGGIERDGAVGRGRARARAQRVNGVASTRSRSR